MKTTKSIVLNYILNSHYFKLTALRRQPKQYKSEVKSDSSSDTEQPPAEMCKPKLRRRLRKETGDKSK